MTAASMRVDSVRGASSRSGLQSLSDSQHHIIGSIHGVPDQPLPVFTSKSTSYASASAGGDAAAVAATFANFDEVELNSTTKSLVMAHQQQQSSAPDSVTLTANSPAAAAAPTTASASLLFGRPAPLAPPPSEAAVAVARDVGRPDWAALFDAVYKHIMNSAAYSAPLSVQAAPDGPSNEHLQALDRECGDVIRALMHADTAPAPAPSPLADLKLKLRGRSIDLARLKRQVRQARAPHRCFFSSWG